MGDIEENLMAPEKVAEMGDLIANQMFGEPQEPQQEAQESNQSIESQDQQIEDAQAEQNEDIPNASIRLDKMRKQRDEERTRARELERKIAEMEGKLSVLDKNENTEQQVDPTQMMDDTEKYLYEKVQGMEGVISKLAKLTEDLSVDKERGRIKEQEERFFESNPELKERREQYVEEVLDYLEDKPALKDMLRKGQVSLGEINGMYQATKSRSKPKKEVANPAVFSGHSQSVPKGNDTDTSGGVEYRKAVNILRDKNSRNKAQAVDFLGKQVTQDILQQIGL